MRYLTRWRKRNMAAALFRQRYAASVAKVEQRHMTDLMASLSNLTVTEQSARNIFAKCNSIAQSKRSTNGKIFETVLEDMLTERKIPFIRQVADKDGVIVQAKRGSVHDIIIDAAVGDAIQDKIIISCKVSLRERYKQDKNLRCRKMFMVTLDKRPSSATAAKYGDIAIVSLQDETALDDMFDVISVKNECPAATTDANE